jgi:hypothetical protein
MDSNNIIYQFTYFPPGGGVYQEEKTTINIGGNMNSNLEEYRLFLGVQYRKPNSQIRYLNAAEKFLGFIQEISKGEIQRYIIHLNQTQKPNAVTSNIVGLNRFLEYLHRKDLRVSTPSWKQITRDTITKEQIIQLVQYAKEHCHYMEYLILLMVRDLDCRNHEIIKTRWDWIHGDKILFKDCKTGDTTGRLTPELQQALQHWRTITPYQSNPYVFCVLHGRYKGSQLSKTGWYIRDFINKLSMEIIGRRLNPQDLRASVITAEYTSYVNPKIIQLKARHRSEKTTQRYNQVDETLVATYIENGTIFSTNNSPVLKAKPEIGKDKRGYINTYPNCIPSNLMEEEEDNTLFSFSVSFFDNEDDWINAIQNQGLYWVGQLFQPTDTLIQSQDCNPYGIIGFTMGELQ